MTAPDPDGPHTPRRLVLASASPARLRLLRGAGFDPDVIASGVSEDVDDGSTVVEAVALLARRKAAAVAAEVGDAIVIGCDSLFELDGAALGKPASSAEAVDRWRSMRGRTGRLHTGHCVVVGHQVAEGVATTVVRFGCPTDAEIDAYVATGEPLEVAGAFTLDGRSGPFIDGVDGDPSNVIGLSLPLLRDLLARLGVGIRELWT